MAAMLNKENLCWRLEVGGTGDSHLFGSQLLVFSNSPKDPNLPPLSSQRWRPILRFTLSDMLRAFMWATLLFVSWIWKLTFSILPDFTSSPPPGFSLSLPRRSVRNVLLLSKNVDGDTSIRDPRLTNLGRQQSSEAGRKLASIQHRIQLVLTSPMARTLETSQLAFGSAIERLGKEKVICLPQFQG